LLQPLVSFQFSDAPTDAGIGKIRERVGDKAKAVGIPSPGGFAVYYLITRAWRDLPRRSSGSFAMFAAIRRARLW
jgi:hypothetical protein